MEPLHPESGVLLIAPPMMNDPNFWRTVVLLCEHDESGSFGLVLNRPLTVQLGDVLDDLSGQDQPLSLGGPVQHDTLHFLHRLGDLVTGAIPVVGDIYWGGDFEIVKDLVRSGLEPPTDLRFFLGYAGWSPDQLEDEIESGGWILTPAHPDLIFRTEPEALWRTTLRHMGGDYALLANFPDDPRMN